MPFQIALQVTRNDGTDLRDVPLVKKERDFEIPSSFAVCADECFSFKVRHTDPAFKDRCSVKIDAGIPRDVWDDAYQMWRKERVTFDKFNEDITDAHLRAKDGINIRIRCHDKEIDHTITETIRIRHEAASFPETAHTQFPDGNAVQKVDVQEMLRMLVGMTEEEARVFATANAFAIRVFHQNANEITRSEYRDMRVNVTLDAANGRVMPTPKIG